MNYPQNARSMDRTPIAEGSIRRAREQVQAGTSREDFDSFTRRMEPSPQQQGQQQRMPFPMPARRQMAAEPGLAMTEASAIPPAASRIPLPANPAQRRAAPIGLPGRDVQPAAAGRAISRPMPAPQWPLAGPLAAPTNLNMSTNGNGRDTEPYRPPPGRSVPPQRPPRPSRVPSILDSSRVQDPTPAVFSFPAVDQAQAQEWEQSMFPGANRRNSDLSLSQPSSISSNSQPSVGSSSASVASIPDFPVPEASPVSMPPLPPPPRRSVTLGPPPSSRRGASSFYSTTSYVSPIIEESSQTRSHTSYASSAAIPESWGTDSVASPNDAASFYSNAIPEEQGRDSVYEDEDQADNDRDEVQLVRSASIGKRARASLVNATVPLRAPERAGLAPSRSAAPLGFRDGMGYLDAPSSSSATTATAATNRATLGSSLRPDSVTRTPGAVSVDDFPLPAAAAAPNRRASVSPRPPSSNLNTINNMASGEGLNRTFSRLSAIRRPPRLDMDAVRKAEARGSLTSLPDLIRRATRLAASLERGRRPASRMDDLDVSPGGWDDRDPASHEKYQSGLSDMLAAFPPPAQPQPLPRRSIRQSIRNQVSSWPVPLINGFSGQAVAERLDEDGDFNGKGGKRGKSGRRRRCCCGLPLWAILLIVFILLIVVAAAIVIPLEFLVIRKQNNKSSTSNTALKQCQSQLTCENGGTNVVSAEGFCSCICTNGFTGFNCANSGEDGCTSASVTSGTGSGNSLTNVTIGNALPRLINDAQQNFSIPLSGTQIVAMFSAGNLSCTAENALVTFDGEAIRQSSDKTKVVAAAAVASLPNSVQVVTVVVNAAGVETTATTTAGEEFTVFSSTTTVTTTVTPTSLLSGSSKSMATTTTSSTSTTSTTSTASSSTTATATSASQTTTGSANSTFSVTEEVLDFARVAVLYILQEQSLSNAETAQTTLQKLFSQADSTSSKDPVTIDDARNVTLSNGNSVNLITFKVDAKSGITAASLA